MKDLSKKYEKLMDFWLTQRLKRLTKKATDKELIELYYEWYPYYSEAISHNSDLNKGVVFKKAIMGYTAVYSILKEFCERYPSQFPLNEQSWYNNRDFINGWMQSKYRMIKENENHGNSK